MLQPESMIASYCNMTGLSSKRARPLSSATPTCLIHLSTDLRSLVLLGHIRLFHDIFEFLIAKSGGCV